MLSKIKSLLRKPLKNSFIEINSLQSLEKRESIINSGLFQEEYYLVLAKAITPFESALDHYLAYGWKNNINPCSYFSVEYYLTENPDVLESGVEPLLHYIEYGEKEGRKSSVYCSIAHLKKQIKATDKSTLLGHFHQFERSQLISAHQYFDIQYYLEHNPDVASSDASPYFHFLETGICEGRNPRADINIVEYCKQFEVNSEEINPFLHFITVGGEQYLKQQKKDNVANTQEPENGGMMENYLLKGECYEEPEYLDIGNAQAKVKALAYYLPQFHPFKENDEWWGQGFTEWTNVTRGLPRFNGHYQPHLPKHLGYYDLRVKEVMLEQVRYAKAGGLHGFCFYHYWFNGKRIMEKPVNMLLENKDIDFPFCIMWANENWTRTWDGLENDVLIAQDYLEEDDIPFVKDIGRHFADGRYIRIEGRPLFFIYRPGIIPNAKETIQKWRDLCKELLNEEPLFYMAQAFGDLDPTEFGMDGAIEFPPHKVAEGLKDASREKGGWQDDFEGHYPSYDELIEKSLNDDKATAFPLIKGVTPTWDNEARKPSKGMGFVDSTPKKYEHWLRNVNQYAKQNPIAKNESFVIINAWNEWAEGAHLEPDVYNGAAYLNATYRAMHNVQQIEGKQKLVLVGHDAYKHGAQLLTLNIFKTLKQRFGIDVVCVLLDGGPLVDDYKAVGETLVANGSLEVFTELADGFAEKGYTQAVCNTTVTGLCTEVLTKANFEIISLIHELKTLIAENSLEKHAETIAENASKVIFASKFVQDSFEGVTGSIGDKAIVKPQGIYQTLESNEKASSELRKKLGLKSSAKVVVNSGFADLRKGFDLFVQIAKETVKRDENYHFVWLGAVEPSLNSWILKDIENTQLMKHIHIVPFTLEISLYLQGANAFAMTSREDPFPSVVLESLALGTPVIGFENGGGFVDALHEPHFGTLVAMADCSAFVDAIELQIANDNNKSIQERATVATETYDWNDYVFSLLEYLNPDLKRVSVAVTNYNYEKHIADRLTSIFNQTYPVYEVVVLDDKSPDGSIDMINATTATYQRDIELVINKQNSGSVFKQWEKGVRLTKGEYLWIAEADDLAVPNFLEVVMAGANKFTMAYTDSKQIDENDKRLADDYRYYYDQSMVKLLGKPATYSGKQVIEDCLSIKNQFMNVSSVVFAKQDLVNCFDKHMDELLEFKVAGDWFVYVQLLLQKDASCKLIGESLNVHRRHPGSVTRLNYKVQLKEIENIQKICAKRTDVDTSKQSEYLDEVNQILKG
jgi:glycosyltransferase involved in cell wall biosynthesis